MSTRNSDSIYKEAGVTMTVFLFAGLSLGLSAGFSPGPLLAMAISHTLRYGRGAGMKVAFAPLISDVPIVTGITLLLSSIYAYTPLLGIISLAGALFVMYLAYESATVQPEDAKPAAEPIHSLFQATIVNILNPHPYLFWIAIGSPMILSGYQQGIEYAAAFILPFYGGLIGAKVILVILVNRSRSFLTGRVYKYIMRFLGLLLFLFALYLFQEGIRLLMR